MIYYTVYKITNNTNGKYYIGAHKTDNLEDDYMGSGLLVKRSIDKYGIDNFTKEYLAIFDSSEEMFALEERLVDTNDENCYNLKHGGNGGFDYINSNGLNIIDIDKKLIQNKKQSDMYKSKGYKPSQKCYSALSEHHKTRCKEDYITFKGKSHTKETKKKIGEANSKHQSGKGNSQYGSMWITDGSTNKKIKKTDPLPKGFKKGRK